MLKIRRSRDRGQARLDWLDSRHTFSFGHYRDLEHMGFGALRVINEDIVMPRKGFGSHPHSDMEIITYVMEGALQHRDSLGNGSVIVPGDVQRMSAGTGIIHSEFNAREDASVHLLQIWILPEKEGLQPGYEQKNFTVSRRPGALTLLASRDGRLGSVTVHQDVLLFVLDLDSGQSFSYALGTERMLWAQVARGTATLNGEALYQGDGVAVSRVDHLQFTCTERAEILLFDLARQVTLH